MDSRKLIELLRATIDPNQRKQAEDQLEQIHKIIGFAPSLLQVVMMNDCEMPIRQAGAIYLKNLISQSWQEKEVEPGQPLPFALHEQDRALIRESIVDAVVHAPELIRIQLCSCVNNMVKHDFPGRWTQIVDKISIYLSNPDASGWYGALLCLYQLVKNFEYKKAEERAPLIEAMNLLLPQLYQMVLQLMPDPSEQSVLLQKTALKVYFALTQYALPLELITKEIFTQWMEVCRQVVDRPVPPAALQPDEDERSDVPWWKCKKWALHILYRVFERYGSPGNVTKEYTEFANWYLPTFSSGILEVLLKQLDMYRNKTWLPPRVVQQTLNYLNQAVAHSLTWKLLKPHMPAIIQDIIFPIMSYSPEDEELWTVDPHEYIRLKYDVFEDYISPVTASQTLLRTTCRKRSQMLEKTMQLLDQVLNNPTTDAAHKDGALHMIGSLSDVLLRRKAYNSQVDQLFIKYVFPEFASPRGHMRARACWMIHYFSEFSFAQEQVLAEAIRLTVTALLQDKDLPVKFEAAVAVQSLLSDQESTRKYFEGQIKQVALELLTLIRETESEDLTSVMQKIVCVFTAELTPIAVEVCQHLAATFSQVLDSEEGSTEKAITAMGILNTIETLLTVMEERPEIQQLLEPTVLQVIAPVLQNQMQEFYEEVFALISELTSKSISNDMWKVFELMYQVFMKNGLDNFTDMMPALHNYITVATDAFLSDEQRLLAIYTMCKEVMSKDCGEDPESHAAKLLEVVILQCHGRIDHAIPMIVELAAVRLLRLVRTSELRTMCIQVLIAALYYNPHLLFSILDKRPGFTEHFIKQWFSDIDCFLGLHDRKICLLGLCTLITMHNRPDVVNGMSLQIVPALVMLFEGLKRAYANREAEDGEEEESESDGDDSEEELSTDEDDVDENSQQYLENLGRRAVVAGASVGLNVTARVIQKDGDVVPADAANTAADDNDDDDDSEYNPEFDPNDETVLESYTTPIDEKERDMEEYIVFKEIMQSLRTTQPEWYMKLTSNLTEQQSLALMEVAQLADQRKAAIESNKIKQQGGYIFTQQTVPTSFNFGGSNV